MKVQYETAKKPVREGEMLRVRIDKLGHKGDGITIINKFIVIVPNTEVGKVYDVEVMNVREKCAFAVPIMR